MPHNPPKKVQCKCFYCATTPEMGLTLIGHISTQTYYLCPNCNAANSPLRVMGDIKKGKAKEVK